MRLPLAAAAIFALIAPAYAQDDGRSIRDLDFFIGDWEGRSTFLYPRDETREPAHEDVRASCSAILKETYIQCDTTWTRADGRIRTFRLHFNYNDRDDGYQTLFIYDNWPRNVSYLLQYDDAEGAYVGRTTFETGEGVAGEERVVWRVSDDGREIRSEEFTRLETDTNDELLKSFEFVWRKVD